ncbi:MAG: hypothetical protein ACOYXM_12670 [Actinomycetota bacterium]
MSQAVVEDASFEIGDAPVVYRVTYLLEDLSDPAVEPSTDVVLVRRPVESRLETYAGEPPGDELLSVQIAAVDRLRLGQPDRPLVVARVPGVGASDLRIRPILRSGVERGLLELGEQRQVSGRRCQVVTSGTLLGAGPLVPITSAERAESCFDADGLLLEELLFLDGKATLHRIAVHLDTAPDLPTDAFEVGEIEAPVDEGGGSSTPVVPTEGALGSFWILPAPEVPTGFEHRIRLSVIPPQPDRFAEPSTPGVIAGTADVYIHGADLVVIWQGGTLGGLDAYDASPHATQVEAASLGSGELLLSARGTEVRFARPGGRFVHVVGTLDPAALTDIARSLVETEGTGLVPIHDG